MSRPATTGNNKNLLKSLPFLRATFEKNALSGRPTTAIMYTNTFFPLIFVSFSCVLLGTLPKFVSLPECAKTILNIWKKGLREEKILVSRPATTGNNAAAEEAQHSVESSKLPLFYADPDKDQFTADQWMEQFKMSRPSAFKQLFSQSLLEWTKLADG